MFITNQSSRSLFARSPITNRNYGPFFLSLFGCARYFNISREANGEWSTRDAPPFVFSAPRDGAHAELRLCCPSLSVTRSRTNLSGRKRFRPALDLHLREDSDVAPPSSARYVYPSTARHF
jgi:hypothetical protein